MTPTLYELDSHGEAVAARHYCCEPCRDSAAAGYYAGTYTLVDEPSPDLADGAVCDRCSRLLEDDTAVEALRLIDAAFRLAERSTPANLRRAILDARRFIQK